MLEIELFTYFLSGFVKYAIINIEKGGGLSLYATYRKLIVNGKSIIAAAGSAFDFIPITSLSHQALFWIIIEKVLIIFLDNESIPTIMRRGDSFGNKEVSKDSTEHCYEK
jgi:hypothetical protein